MLVHEEEPHRLSDKGKFTGVVVNKKGYADGVLDYERTHYYGFPWKRSNCEPFLRSPTLWAKLVFFFELCSCTHTHTHTYIYIYIYMCVCVCVCLYHDLCMMNNHFWLCELTKYFCHIHWYTEQRFKYLFIHLKLTQSKSMKYYY